jgi:hypothetical protein
MRAHETRRRHRLMTSGLSLAASILCTALCSPLPARAADYTYDYFHDDYVVEADGSYVETMEVRETPLSRSTVEDMGQVDLSYSQNLAGLEVLEAYVMKRDGKRIDVPEDAMKLQDDAASDGSPMFTDEKHRIIIFPQLEVEDSIVYKVRIRQHVAYFPGHFLESWNFPRDVDVDDARVDISVPKAHPLFVVCRTSWRSRSGASPIASTIDGPIASPTRPTTTPASRYRAWTTARGWMSRP